MKRFEWINKPATWTMSILMTASMAGCGGSSSSSELPAAPAGSSASASAGGTVSGTAGGTGGGIASGTGGGTSGGTGGACTGTACVNIGTSANYAILTKTGVSTVPSSVVTGNVGVSPAARTYLTGWSPIAESSDTFYTSTQVVAPGKLYAADMVGGTTTADLAAAVLDMGTAYTAAAGMAPAGGGLTVACPGVGAMSDANDVGAFGGSGALPAGVYTCAVNVTIPGTLTLNGSATDVWVFKITGTLTQANGIHVNLTGGALSQNVFWQVSGVVTIGTTAIMQGVVLAQTNIAVQTGATVNGRLLAQTAVTLEQATITAP